MSGRMWRRKRFVADRSGARRLHRVTQDEDAGSRRASHRRPQRAAAGDHRSRRGRSGFADRGRRRGHGHGDQGRTALRRTRRRTLVRAAGRHARQGAAGQLRGSRHDDRQRRCGRAHPCRAGRPGAGADRPRQHRHPGRQPPDRDGTAGAIPDVARFRDPSGQPPCHAGAQCRQERADRHRHHRGRRTEAGGRSERDRGLGHPRHRHFDQCDRDATQCDHRQHAAPQRAPRHRIARPSGAWSATT